MSPFIRPCLLSIALASLYGCASLPNAPSVMVLPGNGMSYEQFLNDEATCKRYAYLQIGGTLPNEAATQSGLATAAAGTAVGAAAGAAIAGGGGAAVGAGAGLAAGSVAGTAVADRSYYGTQRAYDTVFIQCMYAKGHRVPVSGQFSDTGVAVSKPRSANIPPPPPGSPPAPPPAATRPAR